MGAPNCKGVHDLLCTRRTAGTDRGWHRARPQPAPGRRPWRAAAQLSAPSRREPAHRHAQAKGSQSAAVHDKRALRPCSRRGRSAALCMLLLLLSLLVFTPRSHRRLLLLLLLLLWFSKQPRTAGHDQVCRSQLHGRTSCHCHCTGLRLLRCQLRVLAELGSACQQQQGRRRGEDGHIRAQEGWRAGRQQPPHQGPLIALQRLQGRDRPRRAAVHPCRRVHPSQAQVGCREL